MTDQNLDKVMFFYMERVFNVRCNYTDNLETIFKSFIKLINENLELKEFDFCYEDKILDEYSKSLNQIIDTNKNIIIHPKRKLKIIKCPKCDCNDCIINIDNYQIVFYGCCKKDKKEKKEIKEKKEHISYYLLGAYHESQRIEFSKIGCSESGCKKKMNNEFHDFFICMNCTKKNKYSYYLCNEHSEIEDHAKHEKRRYDNKHYFCEDHFGKLKEYCFICNKNLCQKCLKEHEGDDHKVKSYDSLTPDLDDIKKNLDEIKKKIVNLKSAIGDIKKSLDGALGIYENYCKIANDIIEKYEFFNKDLKNYRILRSFLNLKLSNKNMKNELEDILKGMNGENKGPKIEKLISIYKTDREIYNGEKDFKLFSPMAGEAEYNEWKNENAIKEIKKQNTSSNKGTDNGKSLKRNGKPK